MPYPAVEMVKVDTSKFTPKNRVQMLRIILNKITFEREQAVDVILSSCITGLPVCLYGWPGTGKTMLIEAIAKASSGKYAYVLGNQTMKPSELAGIPDMKKLREDSKLHYNTEDRIFDADFGFLDEAGKAPSYALNLMLRAMNEKRGPNNEPINLTLFLASNEPMTSPAFLDRIVMSLWFDDVKNPKHRTALKRRDAGDEYTPEMPAGFVDPSDFKSVKKLIETEVAISDEMYTILTSLETSIYYDKLTANGSDDIPPHRISTRKGAWIQRMLRAIAWLRGMSEITLELIEEIYPLALWHDPADRRGAVTVVSEAIKEIKENKERLEQELAAIDTELNGSTVTQEKIPELSSRLKSVALEIASKDYCEYLTDQVDRLNIRIKDVASQIVELEAMQLFETIERLCARDDLYLQDWNYQASELLSRLKKTKLKEKLSKRRNEAVKLLRQEVAKRNGVDVPLGGSNNGHSKDLVLS